MTAVETPSASLDDNLANNLANKQLVQLFQYTVEAYKTFQKLAENLPNPMTAEVFEQFAVDERKNRDLIEVKLAAAAGSRLRASLGADTIFSDILEGELSYRESAELLISRERTMQQRLRKLVDGAAASDRNFFVYIETVKRAHIVELERELELIRNDADWWRREDAEWRIVHGAPSA